MSRRSASIVTLLALLVTALVLVAIARPNEIETAEAADPKATPAITEPPDTPTAVPPDESADSGAAARRNACQQGGAVGRQARFNELADDCAALLALKSTLAGTGTLNWSASTAIADWDGVTVKSRRVIALRLRDIESHGDAAGGAGEPHAAEGAGSAREQPDRDDPGGADGADGADAAALAGQPRHQRLRAAGAEDSGDERPAPPEPLERLPSHVRAGAGRAAAHADAVAGEGLRGAGGAEGDAGGDGHSRLERGRSDDDWEGLGFSEDGRVAVLVLLGHTTSAALPAALGQLTGLVYLNFHGMGWTGAIPAELGQLTKVSTLILSNNKLTGSIPRELGKLTALRNVNLTGNALTGCAPYAWRDVATSKPGVSSYCPAMTIGKLTARTAAYVLEAVPAGERLQLDVEVEAHDAVGEKLSAPVTLAEGVVIGWYVLDDANAASRQAEANEAVTSERGNAATSPAAPLASVAEQRGSVYYTPPASAIGTTVRVRAVVSEAYCPGDYAVGVNAAAPWDGACAAEFVINVVRPVVQTYGLTLVTPPAHGGLSASPEPKDNAYDPGTVVTVTATPQFGYALRAWGGDCADTPASSATCVLTMDGDKTVSATFATESTQPRLYVIGSESPTSLQLEWAGGPREATSWQYRTRIWTNAEPGAWSRWTTIPGSTGGTRSYTLPRLTAGTAYEIGLRALGSGAQVLAEIDPFESYAEAYTRPLNDLPQTGPHKIVEGDGKTQWRISGSTQVIVIPDGMRLRFGRWAVGHGGGVGQPVYDHASPSVLFVEYDEDTQRMSFTGREVASRPSGSGDSQADSVRDVNALFDQIVSSLTDVALP